MTSAACFLLQQHRTRSCWRSSTLVPHNSQLHCYLRQCVCQVTQPCFGQTEIQLLSGVDSTSIILYMYTCLSQLSWEGGSARMVRFGGDNTWIISKFSSRTITSTSGIWGRGEDALPSNGECLFGGGQSRQTGWAASGVRLPLQVSPQPLVISGAVYCLNLWVVWPRRISSIICLNG